MRLCNDCEISSSVVLVITTIKRRGWGGGGVLQCGYCADLGCNAGVGVCFRCSCLSFQITGLNHKISHPIAH